MLKNNKKQRQRIVTFLVFVIGCVLTLWAFFFEHLVLNINQHKLWLYNWPKECDGLTIALLADLHTGSPFHGLKKLEEMVERTNHQQVDLVLIAGDFIGKDVVGGEDIAPELMAKPLSMLNAKLGVYAVLGNHDWWYGAERVLTGLAQSKIQFLEDASTQLQWKDCRFAISGISDYWEGPHNVKKALAEIPDVVPVIALTHNPDVFDDIPDRVAITLAGHTHGGQVNFPWVGRLIVPSRFGSRFAAGHIEEKGKHLFVNTGTGTSILPVRFRVPPEISILTLKSKYP